MSSRIDLDRVMALSPSIPLLVVPTAENGFDLFWSTNGSANTRVVTVKGIWFPLHPVYTEIPPMQLDPHYYGCSDFVSKQAFAKNLNDKLKSKSHPLFHDFTTLEMQVFHDGIDKICENYIEVLVKGVSAVGYEFEDYTWAILLPGNCSVIEKL